MLAVVIILAAGYFVTFACHQVLADKLTQADAEVQELRHQVAALQAMLGSGEVIVPPTKPMLVKGPSTYALLREDRAHRHAARARQSVAPRAAP